MALLTNTGDLLTNLPSEGGEGGGSDPAEVVDALTVADQAARLALTATDVQPGDLVLQTDTDPATVWVLVAEDPSEAGNWVRWVSGTFVELEGNGDPHISRWGTYGFVQGSPSGGMEIGWGVPDIGSSLSRIAFGLGAGGTTAALTGLLAVGLYEAAAPLHARSSTGAQIIGDHSSGNQFALQADGSGNLTITPSGTLVTLPSGKNLAITAPTVPGSASATGVAGQIAWDSGYIYVCTASNTWKRVAIATW